MLNKFLDLMIIILFLINIFVWSAVLILYVVTWNIKLDL